MPQYGFSNRLASSSYDRFDSQRRPALPGEVSGQSSGPLASTAVAAEPDPDDACENRDGRDATENEQRDDRAETRVDHGIAAIGEHDADGCDAQDRRDSEAQKRSGVSPAA